MGREAQAPESAAPLAAPIGEAAAINATAQAAQAQIDLTAVRAAAGCAGSFRGSRAAAAPIGEAAAANATAQAAQAQIDLAAVQAAAGCAGSFRGSSAVAAPIGEAAAANATVQAQIDWWCCAGFRNIGCWLACWRGR